MLSRMLESTKSSQVRMMICSMLKNTTSSQGSIVRKEVFMLMNTNTILNRRQITKLICSMLNNTRKEMFMLKNTKVQATLAMLKNTMVLKKRTTLKNAVSPPSPAVQQKKG